MNYEKLVCPECGNSEFNQRHCTVLDTTVEIYPYGCEDISDEIIDDDRETTITCTHCGFETDLDIDLIPESEYDN